MNQTAQHLASKGRYGDTTLVHMSPQEVRGLQALARNNGTSLTINPSTGLPEAFSLRSLLPMVAGMALGPAGMGLSALQAGMITGGLGALATGSLKQGLMMGLGAAGGAGLAGSMSNLAAPAASAATLPTNAVVGAPAAMGGAGTGITVPTAAINTSATPAMFNSTPFGQVGLNAKSMALPPLETAGGVNYGFTSASAPAVNMSLASPVSSQSNLLATNLGPLDAAKQSAIMGQPAPPLTGSGMTLDPRIYGRPFDANITKVFPGGGVDAMPNAYTLGDPSLSTNYPLSDATLRASARQPALGGSAMQSMPSPSGGVSSVSGPMDAAEAGRLRMDALRSQTAAPAVTDAAGYTGSIRPATQVIDVNTLPKTPTMGERFGRVVEGGKQVFSSPQAFMDFAGDNKMNLAMSAAPGLFEEPEAMPGQESFIRPYSLEIDNFSDRPASPVGREDERLRYRYTAGTPYRAAQGGIIAFAQGGNTTDGQELMTNPALRPFEEGMMLPPLNPQRLNAQKSMPVMGVPQGYAEGGQPKYRDVRKKINRMEDPYSFAAYQSGRGLYDAAMQNFAGGGLSNVPRFLSGGGDGMSDSIPATINDRQPARLADGEFVIPADVVSHLGNGSSKAGAKQLYDMMDRVRSKRTGKKKQAPAVNPKKMMPA